MLGFEQTIEAIKSTHKGTNEPIEIATTSVPRAISYLESQGFQVEMETAKYQDDKLVSVCLKDAVAGFALQLLQK